MQILKRSIQTVSTKEVEFQLPYFSKTGNDFIYFCIYGQGDRDAFKVSCDDTFPVIEKIFSETAIKCGNVESTEKEFTEAYKKAQAKLEKILYLKILNLPVLEEKL